MSNIPWPRLNHASDRLCEALFAQWRLLQVLRPEDQARLDKKFRLEFNYNSNHLEGNTLTYGETELLLIFDDTRGTHTMREYEEMKAHDVAWRLVQQYAADAERPLTEQFIRRLNEILLVRPFWKDAQTADGQPTRRLITGGEYKQHPNSVRLANGEIFHYASPTDTPIEMGELMAWYRAEETVHPITIAAMLHYKFVRIHPFDDGNGRVARLLMNYVLLRHSYLPVVIKSVDKAAYLRALHIADTGDFSELIAYIAEQAVWSLELAIKAAKEESIEEPNDWEKQLHLLRKRTDDLRTVQKSRSAAVLHELGNDFVIELICRMIKKFVVMEDLFVGKNCYAILDRASVDLKTGNELEDYFSATAEMPPQQLQFKYRLQGYKRDGTNTFEVAVGVRWEFEAYRYRVELTEMTDGRKLGQERYHLYGEAISKAYINEIIGVCGASLVRQIEASTSSGDTPA